MAAEHPRRLLAEAIWAQLKIAQGDLAAADASLATLKQHMAGNDIRIERRYLAVLAERQRKAGEPAAAARSLQQLVKLYEAQVGVESVETAQQRVRLADALAAAGQCGHARAEAGRAMGAIEQQLLPGSGLRNRALALASSTPGCS